MAPFQYKSNQKKGREIHREWFEKREKEDRRRQEKQHQYEELDYKRGLSGRERKKEKE